MVKTNWIRIFWTIVVVLVLLVAFLFSPLKAILPTGVKQTNDYDSSVKAIQAEQKLILDILNPDCVSKLMTHGKKAKGVIVMFHGYTSCPQQFAALGKRFFDEGYNVYIPRAPYHGYKNLLTDDVGKLTAREYVDYAEASIAKARGLGNEIVVTGLSGGGGLTIWAAQHLAIDKALIISPGLGIYGIPEWITPPLVNIYKFLPNQFRWWNDEDRGKHGLLYEYPRFSVKVLTQVFTVSRSVLRESLEKAPLAKKIIMIYNDNDKSISLPPVKTLEQRWRAQAKDRIFNYAFGADLKLPHQVISPDVSKDNIDQVFDKLVELVRQ